MMFKKTFVLKEFQKLNFVFDIFDVFSTIKSKQQRLTFCFFKRKKTIRFYYIAGKSNFL